MPRLRDVLPDRPRVLFVGINPSLRSGETGNPFAGPGNPFWRLLHAAALTPVLLAPSEYHRLAEWRLGLTNLCPRPTRAAAELRPEEINSGRVTLARKITRIRPTVVAFVGLTLYQHFFAHSESGGAGEKPERPAGAHVFVVPNPSGLNASFPGFHHKLVWFTRLRDCVDRIERIQPA